MTVLKYWNGASWVPAVVGQQGTKGDKGDIGDPGLVWKGTWSSLTQYSANDVVEFNGSAYVCVQSNGNDPGLGDSPISAGLFWDLLAQGVNPSTFQLPIDQVTSSYQNLTASRALLSSDKGRVITVESGSTQTFTVDKDLLSAGDSITFIQTGVGQIQFTAETDGTNLRSADGATATRAQFSSATLIWQGVSEVYLIGDLA